MRSLTALALLFSVQAFACPDLTGTYTCAYQDGSSEVITLSQSVDKDGITVFNYNGSQIPADNQLYPIPDDDTLKEGTFRAWCDTANPALLQSQLLGKYWNNGAYYGDLTMNMTFSLSGRDLKQTTQGTLKNAGGEYPLNSELVCTRN
ncbi:MAG: hypothetical protein KF799_01575 [Bdellovibrionales bacterium]|nr:hypothetical protein [Bdellovibrionales bacterium]